MVKNKKALSFQWIIYFLAIHFKPYSMFWFEGSWYVNHLCDVSTINFYWLPVQWLIGFTSVISEFLTIYLQIILIPIGSFQWVKQGSVELLLHNQLVIVTFNCFKIRPINNTTQLGVWHGDIKKDLYWIIIFLKYRNKTFFIKLK